MAALLCFARWHGGLFFGTDEIIELEYGTPRYRWAATGIDRLWKRGVVGSRDVKMKRDLHRL